MNAEVLSINGCRLCGQRFEVTREMVARERKEMPPEYGPMTDDEVVNIIECCPDCAGLNPEEDTP